MNWIIDPFGIKAAKKQVEDAMRAVSDAKVAIAEASKCITAQGRLIDDLQDALRIARAGRHTAMSDSKTVVELRACGRCQSCFSILCNHPDTPMLWSDARAPGGACGPEGRLWESDDPKTGGDHDA